MMNDDPSSTIHFSPYDLNLFSTASHDRNPIHLSPEYARRTSYGQQVVFGGLGAFACLGRVEPPLNCSLSRISLEFPRPMFLHIDYKVTVSEPSPRTRSVKLFDGSRMLLKACLTFAEGVSAETVWGELGNAARQIPVDRGEKEFTEGAITRGEYWPDQAALTELLSRFAIDERAFGKLQLSALLWSSYVVGMELPGLRSLFNKLILTFENLEQCRCPCLSYEAKVISLNSFGLLRSELRLFAGAQLVGRGEGQAFVLPRSRVGSVTTAATLVPPSHQLKGKVALVVGASRGLGAMLTAAFALQGCTVLANFNRSESEAHRLQQALVHAPGRVTLEKGDAADLVWCQELEARVSHEFGRLDFLICNACPSILPLRLEPEMVGRINSYVGSALALVSVPVSVFSRLLNEKSGWSVIISSAAVEAPPQEWPHYVAVKCAIEGLAHVAALQYPNANFLLVRPSRLWTDLTSGPSNVPFAHRETMLPEVAAAKIVQHLHGEVTGAVEMLTVNDGEESALKNRPRRLNHKVARMTSTNLSMV
jgi:NAD(P)-dependent dehydrogenase (short-subunit alcohol dehydrogenase family)